MNTILAFATSSKGKICLNLLDENDQLEGWFAPFAVIIFVFFVVSAYRAVGHAQSRAQARVAAAAVCVLVCIGVLVIGWTMFQFFDPTC